MAKKKTINNKDSLPSSNQGKRNRRAGHSYERSLVNKFKELGFTDAATSRRMSRALDDAKVDIFGLPYNVQAKNVISTINYENLMNEVKEAIKKTVPRREHYPLIIAHKKKGKSFMVMTEDDFFAILKAILTKEVLEELNKTPQW